jgi:nicotinate-nucleotide pyrophosphorylase (carboxylating)
VNLPYLTPQAIHSFIQSAIHEDVGDGDHSSLASIPASRKSRARVLIKDTGILAGMAMAEHIFKQVDPELHWEVFLHDGDHVQPGDIGLLVEGSARSLLKAERLVLNCMQRMSGIATYTRKLVDMVEGTGVKLLDTRKTTPNFRLAEKWAVAIGGGTNHRFGLYDMIMLKDNHIEMAGGIRPALEATKSYLITQGMNLRIEVETRNLQEIEEVLEVGGVDVIMLDNMTPAQMREAVLLINKRTATEASGGITEATIREVAETGVDFISVGALTHSFKSLDISLKAIKNVE